MKRIFLPLDETERSRKALDFVSRHYKPEDTEIVIMMVDESQTYTINPEAEAAAIEALQKKLDEVKEAEQLKGFKIITRADTGKAGLKITRAARQVGAEYIVMTRSSKEDMLSSIGTTTEYVINNAPCHVLIVNENAQAKEKYRGLVYKTASAVVNLRGTLGNKQSECLLPSVNVDCIYHFDVTVGKIRFMHVSYNPESRNWDLPPAPGQPVTLDIAAGESVDVFVKADSNEGKADRIRIVNRDTKKEAVFNYKIFAAPKK